jgi:hypothetical protein
MYFQETFQGISGTVLNGRQSNTGAIWTGSSNLCLLDGNGMVYESTTGNSFVWPVCAMPTTLNFTVMFDIVRKDSTSTYTGVCFQFSGGGSTRVEINLYDQGSPRFYIGTQDTVLGSIAWTYPAIGVTWRIKVVISTSGSNTTYSAYYSSNGGGSWTALTNYTGTTISTPIQLALRMSGGTQASTPTTGAHIGNLVLFDGIDPRGASLLPVM